MSLNPAQCRRTSDELHDNYGRAGLTPAMVHGELGLAPGELERVLDMHPGVEPVTVWKLRDYLEPKVLESGGTPRPYFSLTEGMRSAANRWFGMDS
ncbi:DUF2316 family protein [Zafaria sp. Z1313]|uniref:DUF2316 family protein n=1 Tax=Zafaria sp. Z1313 TaxID=3423202 RepID=UPI003D303D5F